MQPLIALENGKPIIVINPYANLNPIGTRNLRGAPIPVNLSELTDDNALEFLRAVQGYYEQVETGTLSKSYKHKHLSGKTHEIKSLRGTTLGEI